MSFNEYECQPQLLRVLVGKFHESRPSSQLPAADASVFTTIYVKIETGAHLLLTLPRESLNSLLPTPSTALRARTAPPSPPQHAQQNALRSAHTQPLSAAPRRQQRPARPHETSSYARRLSPSTRSLPPTHH